jgi:hypothetical protein
LNLSNFAQNARELMLWIRNTRHFNLKLVWRGDDKIFVVAPNDGVIDMVRTRNGSSDQVVVGKLMNKIEEDLHNIATGMENVSNS